MQLPLFWGYLGFFLIPISLWLFGAVAVRRRPLLARLVVFIAGSDNRLSLSRLQAFSWTLVIFGSFASAMLVHTHINSNTDTRSNQLATSAKADLEKADSDLKSSQAKEAKLKALLDDSENALAVAEVNAQNSRALAAGTTGQDKDAFTKKAEADRLNRETLSATLASYRAAYGLADKQQVEALDRRNKAEQRIGSTSSEWVKIPPALLALAGIAISSGVFSSLIAGVNADEKTACVTRLTNISSDNLKIRFADANVTAQSKPLLIEGVGLGSAGRVRIGSQTAPILFWADVGDAIAVDLTQVKALRGGIVVETANGKLAYELSGTLEAISLGLPAFKYDLADLFRDDKNPSIFSLMKFQMFGWTVIAIGIYGWIFLSNLGPDMSSLPLVDASIVLLTGVSQGGYLAGKAISNVGVKASDQ